MIHIYASLKKTKQLILTYFYATEHEKMVNLE